MGIFFYCSKCGKRTDNTCGNNLCRTCEPTDFYFNVWCKETGYTQANPWKIQQIVAQNMQTAAKMFVKDYDKNNGMFFAENSCTQLFPRFNNFQCCINTIVFVQDWRGRIAKFEITIKNCPVYIVRRIK